MSKGRVLLLLIIVLVGFTSCKPEHEKTIQSKKLEGTYKIDLSQISEKSETAEDTLGIDIAQKLAGFAISSFNLKVVFKTGGKGEFDIDGRAMQFLRSFSISDEDLEKNNRFEYKIERDSVLLLKMENESGFKPVGILTKKGKGYSALRLKIRDREQTHTQVELTLKKIADED